MLLKEQFHRIHLTFQEYFAAVYISNLSLPEQLDHFVNYEAVGRMRVVLRFLNRLNCLNENNIGKIFESPTQNRNFSQHTLSCNVAVSFNLVNWMFEAQSDEVFALILGEK